MENNVYKTNNGLIGLVILVIVIFVGGYFLLMKDTTFSKMATQQSTTASFKDNGQVLSKEIISCEFKVVSNFTYQNNETPWSDENRKIYHHTDNSESEPNLVTFAGLSSKQPRVKGNAGDSPLKMLKNDDETMVLVEENSFGDMFTYTIFKKEKVAVWYKAYKLINSPFGMVSMGHCY